jgi:hypothetical protein
MMAHLRAARQEEPHGVGEEGRVRGARTVEITFARFDSVFTVAPRAVEVFIHLLGRRGLSGGHHQTRSVASGHDFCLDKHPPRLVP